MKICVRCKEEKENTEFYGHPETRDRLQPRCKRCTNDYRPRKAYFRQRIRTLKGKAAQLLHAAKARAKAKSLEFDLTQEWVEQELSPGKCSVTGIAFDLNSTGHKPWGPSLDRIDPTEGYTQDNTQVVCWMYNAAKGTGTHEDVLALARSLTT